MECSCEINIDTDDCGPDAFKESQPKARKTHTCYECNRVINKGETYTRESGIWDGKPQTYKTCGDCISIRGEFFTGGWWYGGLRDELHNFISEVGGSISESCIAKLTKGAREYVCQEIEDAWEYEE